MSHDHACIHGEQPDLPPRNETEEAIDEAVAGTGTTRRNVIRGFAAVGATGLLAAGAAQPAAASTVPPRPRRHPKTGARLVLLGTRAGPPPVVTQAGISSALVVNGSTYVIDCGRASVTQFARIGLRYDTVKGIFITHLHADHIADYYNYFLLAGHIKNPDGDHMPDRTPVFGPGPAGGLPPKYGGGTAPTVAPGNPDPGLKDMTEALHRAYAYSSNIFLRDMSVRDIRTLMDLHEIAVPAVGASYRKTAPRMRPFEIFRDENVRVTATLVPHYPVFPAFAYRFETEYGSVTFSGDTAKSDNLIELADRTDILVHEAIGIEGSDAPKATIEHMVLSHVAVSEVGPIAEAARARSLVLSHTADIAKRLDPVAWRRAAQKGYHGRVSVGQDLDVYDVRRRPSRHRS